MKVLLIGALVVVCAALYAVEPPNIVANAVENDVSDDDVDGRIERVVSVVGELERVGDNAVVVRPVERREKKDDANNDDLGVALGYGSGDGLNDELDCEQAEALLYAAPSEETLKKLDGKLELLIFTLKQRDACQGCRVAFEAYNHLEQYPVTNVYLDSVKGRALALDYDASETPTFVLVRRGRNGDGDELARWSGARDVKETCLRVEREFQRVNYNTQERGFKPPKKEPRPIPPPKKEPKPKPHPPKNEPRPVPFWSLFFN